MKARIFAELSWFALLHYQSRPYGHLRNCRIYRPGFGNLASRQIANALTETESISAGSLDRHKDSIHRGDPINDGKPMLRGEMTVAGRHRDRFVAGEFLDLFDRCSGHG